MSRASLSVQICWPDEVECPPTSTEVLSRLTSWLDNWLDPGSFQGQVTIQFRGVDGDLGRRPSLTLFMRLPLINSYVLVLPRFSNSATCSKVSSSGLTIRAESTVNALSFILHLPWLISRGAEHPDRWRLPIGIVSLRPDRFETLVFVIAKPLVRFGQGLECSPFDLYVKTLRNPVAMLSHLVVDLQGLRDVLS